MPMENNIFISILFYHYYTFLLNLTSENTTRKFLQSLCLNYIVNTYFCLRNTRLFFVSICVLTFCFTSNKTIALVTFIPLF